VSSRIRSGERTREEELDAVVRERLWTTVSKVAEGERLIRSRKKHYHRGKKKERRQGARTSKEKVPAAEKSTLSGTRPLDKRKED